MTAAEKTDLARFLELAAAVTGGGYRNGDQEYHFEDTADESPTPTVVHAAATDNTTDSLEKITADVRACLSCRLCETRTNAVPGEGVSQPLVMVIGEGPGADEDASGRPFVGRAGQLLDKMLASIGLSRESNCFIGNVIKCRPPANRDPQPDERIACMKFLARQITILKPRFILCAGRIAGQALLNTMEPIGSLRGRCIDYKAGERTIPLYITYHPSALLRREEFKRPAWEDLKLLRSAIGTDNCTTSSGVEPEIIARSGAKEFHNVQ
jgi:DNA polymerase